MLQCLLGDELQCCLRKDGLPFVFVWLLHFDIPIADGVSFVNNVFLVNLMEINKQKLLYTKVLFMIGMLPVFPHRLRRRLRCVILPYIRDPSIASCWTLKESFGYPVVHRLLQYKIFLVL